MRSAKQPPTQRSLSSLLLRLLTILLLPLLAVLIVPAGITTAAGETATKVDTLLNDVDGDGVADPGDTIGYTVTITNGSGVDMTNVVYTDTIDANTTLVPGSVEVAALAVDDTYGVVTSGTLNVSAPGVLANDVGVPAPTVTEVEGSAANVGNPISVSGGTLTVNADGSFTYNAPAVSGPVTFTYMATNAAGSSTATVTINVENPPNAVNDAPTANSAPGDPYHTAVDTLLDSSTLPYSVLDNDTGTAPLNVVSFGPTTGAETAAGSPGASAQGGTVTVNANGQFTYDPPTGYVGYDTFVYTMQDVIGSDTATVTIAIGERPTAVNDSYDVIASGTLNIAAPGVLSNDTGSPTLTVTEVNGSAANVGNPITVGGGTLTLNADGSLTYTAPAALGPVNFTYQASNALSGSTATVTITVHPGPTANDDGPAGGSMPGDPYHTGMNQSITGPTAYSVLTNDTGLAPLSVVSYGVNGNEAVPANSTPTTQGGSVTLNTTGNIVNYTPPSATFVGTDTFKYTMTSSIGGSSTATVTIKVGIPPTANTDNYNVHGNIGISITTANDPLNNDTGDQIVVQSYGGGTLPGNNFTTANGGTFNMAANGAFTYNPPVGYTGTDTVNYVISNGLGTSNANITFTISSMIWFIDNSGGAGDGRWGSPFNSLAAFNAVNDGVGNHPKAGDRIYVFTGSGPYGGGIVLLDNQQLIGAGSDLATIVGALPTGSPTLPGAGTKPVIRNTAGIAINVKSGNTIRGLDVGVSGNTTQTGIARSPAGTVGNLTVLDNVTVNANGGAAVDIGSGGTLNVTFGSLTSASSPVQGVRVASSGGTFTVSGTTSVTNSTLAGVNLANNTATITFAALNITNTTTNAPGLDAAGNTGTITSTSGTINTGSGRAVNIDGGAGTTPLAVVLTSVSSSGGGVQGITINKNSGSFTVAGTGSANSGGTIANKTGNTNGVNLTNATNISLSWMLISGNSHNGIFGQTVNGFVLANSTVQNNGDTSPVAGAIDETGIYFLNLSGTVLAGSNPTQILNSTVTGSSVNNIYIQNSSAILDEFRIENSSITGTNLSAFGADGLLAEATSSGGSDGTVRVNVVNSNINNNATDGIQANCLNNGTIDLTVTNSTLSGNNLPINMTPSGTCDLFFDILNNTGGGDGLLSFNSHGINLSTANTSTANGTIDNNTITGSGTNVGFGIRVQADHTSSVTAMISNNIISSTGFAGLNVTNTLASSPTVNANILNNTISAPLLATGGDYGMIVESRNTSNTCMDIFGNTSTGSGAGPAGIRFRQRDTSQMRLERLVATTNVPATVQTHLQTTNAPSTASVTINSGGGGQVVAVADGFCTLPSGATETPFVRGSSSAARLEHPMRSAELDKVAARPLFIPPQSGETINLNIGTIPAGESVTITFEVTIDATIPAATTQVSNQGTVAWDSSSIVTDDPDTAALDDPTITQVPQADLSIAKSDNADPVEVGGQITYTLAVTNNGPSDAVNVVVSDTLPAELTLVSTTGCAEDPNGIPTCTIGTIPNGNTVNITVVANVTGSIAQLSNTAAVSSTTHDPDNSDNSDSEPTDTTPAAPSTLVATAAGQTQIDLTWNDNSSDETSFRIERSPDGSTGWTEIGTTPAGDTTFSDTTAACNTTYHYRVRAHRSGDNQYSGYSNVDDATTDACPLTLNAPTNLVATKVSNTQIDLTWNDNSSDETSFRIERSPDGTAGWTEIDTTPVDDNTYSDTTVVACQDYHYRVRAHRSGDNVFSSYSNTAFEITVPCGIFADVPVTGKEWMQPWIETFYATGITSGCGISPLIYCPERSGTRAEVAVFLIRALQYPNLPYTPTDPDDSFADVPVAGKEWMQPWIEEFYDLGITGGCAINPLRFCPERAVTRAEIAVFILRAKYGSSYVPPAAPSSFSDVPVAGKEWMQPWIEQFYQEEITGGCATGPLRFCPEREVTRAELAVFILRAFDSLPKP